jgi:drug/metabolite transporter (DMT)-like permease
VFVAVLAATFVHAAWNALIKAGEDRLAGIATIGATQILISLALLPFVAPLDPATYPYVAASMVLSTAYMLALQRAYRAGEFSQIYPLARGTAPLVVAGLSVFLLGETIGGLAGLAIATICVGIVSLALARGPARSARDPRPVAWALLTGGLIGCYTTVDGVGVRVAGDASAYMVWMSLATGALTVACALALRGRGLPRPAPRALRLGALAGALSYGSAWTVMWAMAQAPLALVSALRETGIVFAAIIGVIVLKERLDLARAGSIAATLAGTALLKFVR